MLTILPALPIAGFAGFSLAAALSDARTLRIPNLLTSTIFVMFLLHAMLSLSLSETLTSLAIAFATLAVGFGAFTRGWLGGGDAKLLAACMAWAGWSLAAEFLVVTALAGGVLAFGLGSKLTSPFADGLRRNWPGTAVEVQTSMPYGVAITAGAIAVVLELLFS
jgi:prepilin peptidase CpaA